MIVVVVIGGVHEDDDIGLWMPHCRFLRNGLERRVYHREDFTEALYHLGDCNLFPIISWCLDGRAGQSVRAIDGIENVYSQHRIPGVAAYMLDQ